MLYSKREDGVLGFEENLNYPKVIILTELDCQNIEPMSRLDYPLDEKS